MSRRRMPFDITRKPQLLDFQLRIMRCYIQRLEDQDENIMNDNVKTKKVVMTDPEELQQRIGAVGVAENVSPRTYTTSWVQV
jgi:hypothetical protein